MNYQGYKLKYEHPFIITGYGKSDSGKTTWTDHIVGEYLFGVFRNIFLISPHVAIQWEKITKYYTNKHLSGYGQLTHIKPRFFEHFIKRFILQRNKKSPKALIIIDDSAGLLRKNSNIVKNLVTTYKHKNISIIYLIQKITLAPSEIRTNASYIWIFQLGNTIEFKTLLLENSIGSIARRSLKNKNKLKNIYHLKFEDPQISTYEENGIKTSKIPIVITDKHQLPKNNNKEAFNGYFHIK